MEIKIKLPSLAGHQSQKKKKKTMFELYWYVLEDVKHHEVRLAATREAFMYS